jgi:hypothetical protein
MDLSWTDILYNPLNMATISRYPNKLLKESHKWFPKFIGNNIFAPKYNIESIGVTMEDNGIEHEDVVMKLLAMSLDKDAKKWFKEFLENQFQSYEASTKLFKGRWTKNKDN